MHNNVSLV